MIRKIRGTQDFLDLSFFNAVTSIVRDHCKTYNFTEIATPILEPTDLFIRSLGLQTDVVTKQMFTIAKREGSKENICLRPEATAGTMRAFLENGGIKTPWHVFTIGSMFRYERPQKGRYRQFNQINIESIGAENPLYDVQLISMLDRLFAEKLNLKDYVLTLNFLGCSDDRKKFKKLLAQFLEKQSSVLCATCMVRKDTNILRIFDCKNEECQKVYANAPKITDHLCNECGDEWQVVQQNLSMLSVSFVHVPTLVRGLDYYGKTAFEFVSDNLGAQSSFCGGGRYDGLAQELGAKKEVPACGAAIGVERLLLLLQEKKEQLLFLPEKKLQIIIPVAKEQQALALSVADQMRSNGLVVEVLLDDVSLKNKMKKADNFGAKKTLIIGEKEQNNNTVILKNMETGVEESVSTNTFIKNKKRSTN